MKCFVFEDCFVFADTEKKAREHLVKETDMEAYRDAPCFALNEQGEREQLVEISVTDYMKYLSKEADMSRIIPYE